MQDSHGADSTYPGSRLSPDITGHPSSLTWDPPNLRQGCLSFPNPVPMLVAPSPPGCHVYTPQPFTSLLPGNERGFFPLPPPGI